jgi:hypothetical protein
MNNDQNFPLGIIPTNCDEWNHTLRESTYNLHTLLQWPAPAVGLLYTYKEGGPGSLPTSAEHVWLRSVEGQAYQNRGEVYKVCLPDFLFQETEWSLAYSLTQTETRLSNISEFRWYLKENTTLHHYKDQLVNTV